jgi:phosphoribosyl-ATP pyrophosphohydrolase
MAAIDGTVLDRLYGVIESRRGGDPAASYTAKLFSQGAAKIAQKLGEEAVEAVIEGVRGDGARLAQESADLLYHLLVLWAETGVAPDAVWQALEARAGRSGLDEKKSRPER